MNQGDAATQVVTVVEGTQVDLLWHFLQVVLDDVAAL